MRVYHGANTADNLCATMEKAMHPYFVHNRYNPDKTPYGDQRHPLEDPLNWPEQRTFAKLISLFSQLHKAGEDTKEPVAKSATGLNKLIYPNLKSIVQK